MKIKMNKTEIIVTDQDGKELIILDKSLENLQIVFETYKELSE